MCFSCVAMNWTVSLLVHSNAQCVSSVSRTRPVWCNTSAFTPKVANINAAIAKSPSSRRPTSTSMSGYTLVSNTCHTPTVELLSVIRSMHSHYLLTGAKPYECKLCGRQFRQKSQVRFEKENFQGLNVQTVQLESSGSLFL